MQEDISWLEVQDLPGSNCYCDEEAKNRILDDIKNYTGNGIHFIDSGNYQIPEAGMDVPSLTATAGLHNDNFLSQ